MNMEYLIRYMFTLVGRPYLYGGDDPLAGYDCSGLVQEGLMASGVIRRGTPKMNAQQIFDYLVNHGGSQGTYGPGSISFYGGDIMKNIVHVGFCIDSRYMLHAGSGDKTTTSPERAVEQNAFVRMDEISYRKDFLMTVKPVYRTPV